MILLPRLARSLHHPALAVVLGLVLIGIALFGLVSSKIPTLWAVLILVVGSLNVLRAVPRPDVNQSTAPPDRAPTGAGPT